MGILTKGKYTYGNLPWSTIITITGANIGDTVFDTTYNKLRSWDGRNFVHGHQITQETVGGILAGGVIVVASSANNKVDFQRLSTDSEGSIGIGEDAKTGSTGDFITVTYHGDVRILIDGTAAVGNYVRNSVTVNGYGDAVTTSSAGVFGIMIGPAIVAPATNGLRRCLFKPVERS